MLKENSQIKIHMYNSQNEEININQNIYILKSKDGQLGFENEDKKEFTTLSSFDSRVEFEDLSNNNIYYYSHKTDKIQQSEINLTKTYIKSLMYYLIQRITAFYLIRKLRRRMTKKLRKSLNMKKK